eukprot:355947-Chlamydomonas_euryale.AAC.11
MAVIILEERVLSMHIPQGCLDGPVAEVKMPLCMHVLFKGTSPWHWSGKRMRITHDRTKRHPQCKHHCQTLSIDPVLCRWRMQLALAYHDLGLWTDDDSLAYIEPSLKRAGEAASAEGWSEEAIQLVKNIVYWHHKVLALLMRRGY